MLREGRGHAQGQTGVLVGAVGVAQVLAEVAVADHRVALVGERGVERVLGAAGELGDPGALGQRRDQHAVVGVDGRERVAARERAAELVQRQAEAGALGRAELRFRAPGSCGSPSTPTAVPDTRTSPTASSWAAASRAAASSPSSISSNRTSSSRCGFSSSSRRYIAVPISAAVRSAAAQS